MHAKFFHINCVERVYRKSYVLKRERMTERKDVEEKREGERSRNEIRLIYTAKFRMR